jgi:hypothetical protein
LSFFTSCFSIRGREVHPVAGTAATQDGALPTEGKARRQHISTGNQFIESLVEQKSLLLDSLCLRAPVSIADNMGSSAPGAGAPGSRHCQGYHRIVGSLHGWLPRERAARCHQARPRATSRRGRGPTATSALASSPVVHRGKLVGAARPP